MESSISLADIEEEVDSFAADYKDFLLKLIQHNAVSYFSDRDARHWTFIYYVNNARYRLTAIKLDGLLLPKEVDLYQDLNPTETWSAIHHHAELAVSRLEKRLLELSPEK